MVEETIKGSGVRDPRVVRAMLATPRHEFVDPQYRDRAYFDMALPIGEQQTISSPLIVAYMTQCLDPQTTDRVLEIGTGSGYQAAVLSPLVRDVYTIEIVESLGQRATRTLERLGYTNVHTKVGDGYQGWTEHAPFDKIIVTCSPEKPPRPLLDQLKDGGLMVIPVGQRYQQTLYVMRKQDGRLTAEAKQPTLFVPMTGRAEEQRQVLPDAANPQAVNGDFEQGPSGNKHVPGWYYQQQATWETGSRAPQGEHYVSFRNTQAGRSAHLLQGFAVDGRQVRELNLSSWVRCVKVQTQREGEFPAVAVSFYDENRNDLGVNWLGPFKGTFNWRLVQKRFRVPPEAREGILRIGLFGSTGLISFDDVQLQAAR
jgi:protein-L-isoaspartate(D-aspartate) O-methyltransferase